MPSQPPTFLIMSSNPAVFIFDFVYVYSNTSIKLLWSYYMKDCAVACLVAGKSQKVACEEMYTIYRGWN